MRVQKYGIAQVVLGDLVLCKEGSPENIVDTGNTEAEDDCSDVYNCSSVSEMPDEALPEEKVQLVKAVNSEDLLTGGYSFEDVVLPFARVREHLNSMYIRVIRQLSIILFICSSRILYPNNDVAAIFHDMAKKDGICLTESVHGTKEFSITRMTGAYRRVFQRPIDYVWQLLTYIDSNIPLAETDLDFISKRSANVVEEEGLLHRKSGSQTENLQTEKMNSDAKCVVEYGSAANISEVESACNSDAQLPKVALKLGFTLPASCYATMAIRELLKTSTSVACQKTMNL